MQLPVPKPPEQPVNQAEVPKVSMLLQPTTITAQRGRDIRRKVSLPSKEAVHKMCQENGGQEGGKCMKCVIRGTEGNNQLLERR